MKKNVKALIACVAALAVVGGGYAALVLTDDKDGNSTSSSESAAETEEVSVPIPIFEFERADIKSVLVKNSEGEYKGIPVGEPAEDGTVTFTIEGLEDLDINTTLTSSLLNSCSALNTDSTVEEAPSDLSKYGLDKPLMEVTVKTADAEKTLLIGEVSPISGETYCMEKGSKAVYLVSTSNVSVFANNAESYISTTLLEEPAEGSFPNVEEIKIDRTDLDYDIVLAYDKSSDDDSSKSGTLATHYMKEPIFAYLDAQKSQDATHGLFGLSASSVMTAHPTADEIVASGLDKPFCTVTMKTDEQKTYTLKIGNKLDSDSGSYYLAMYGENDVIYAISAENLLWASLKPSDITSKMIFGTYVWDIGRLEIKLDNGEMVSFEGRGSSAEDYTVTKNGNKADAQRFRNFYTFLLKTSAEDFAYGEEVSGVPVALIELETQDGKTKQTIEFYKTDSKKALISVNGVVSFKCRMAYVDLLIDNLAKFDTDEEFVMNW